MFIRTGVSRIFGTGNGQYSRSGPNGMSFSIQMIGSERHVAIGGGLALIQLW